MSLWATVALEALVPLAQITPLLTGLWSLIGAIKALNWSSYWATLSGWIATGYRRLAVFNVMLTTSNSRILQTIGHLGAASLALIRFATVGIFNALKGIGAFILSLVTGGTASATFSTIASTSFGIFATTARAACSVVSTAIMSIPIVGWIAAAIAALIAVGVYFWNTSAKFRAVLKGTWAAFKACFTGIGELAKTVFGAIGDLIKAAFKLDGNGISAALNKLKGGYADFGKQVGNAFNEAYEAEMAASAKEQERRNQGKSKSAATANAQARAALPATPGVATPTVDPTAGTLSSASGTATAGGGSGDGGKIKNITINIEKLVETFTIHTANMGESMEQMRAAVLETLMGAINDTQLAAN